MELGFFMYRKDAEKEAKAMRKRGHTGLSVRPSKQSYSFGKATLFRRGYSIFSGRKK